MLRKVQRLCGFAGVFTGYIPKEIQALYGCIEEVAKAICGIIDRSSLRSCSRVVASLIDLFRALGISSNDI
jgi:hypothetical protein